MQSGKCKSKAKVKVPRLFRLRPDLDKTLRVHSGRTGINQTRLVEMALGEYFAVKKAA